MLGLSFANDIKKIVLHDAPEYYKSFRNLKYFKCHDHKIHLILKNT